MNRLPSSLLGVVFSSSVTPGCYVPSRWADPSSTVESLGALPFVARTEPFIRSISFFSPRPGRGLDSSRSHRTPRFGYEACLNVSEKLEPVALVVRAPAFMRRSPPFNALNWVGPSKLR